jgi:hypothetical protein
MTENNSNQGKHLGNNGENQGHNGHNNGNNGQHRDHVKPGNSHSLNTNEYL